MFESRLIELLILMACGLRDFCANWDIM